MTKRRLWVAAACAVLGLLGAGASSVARREDSAASPEPLAVRGRPGHSIEHARVDLRELALEAAMSPVPETEEERDEPPLRPPRLPVPPGVPLRIEPRHPRAEAIESPRLASPPLASSFAALPDNGTAVPPDTDGAVGPQHLVTILNTEMRVQDRSGKALVTMSFAMFWSKVSAGLSNSDPRILYDPSIDRWIAAAVAGFNTKDASVLVGVSQTGDPTGVWNQYRVDVDPDDKLWADYPCIGFNKDWIAIEVNMATVTPSIDNSVFQHAQIYVFDKANLVAGGTDASHTVFPVDPNFGFTLVPAVTYDPDQPVLYVLEDWNGNMDGRGLLALFSISGPVGSEVFRMISFPGTDAIWDDFPSGTGDFGPQQGTTTKITTNDANFSQVVFRNGLITAAHTLFLPAGAPTRSAIQWWQLTTDGSVASRGRLDDPSGGTFYAFPSVAPNKNNDLLIGFSTFSAQTFASGGYVFRAASDAPGSLRDGALLKSGEAAYVRTGMGKRNRWGDYSSSGIDPVNGLDLWTIQEFAGSAASLALSNWGTWWGRIVPDAAAAVPLPLPSFTSAGSAVAGQPVLFTDTSSGATQWFWNFGDGSTSADRNPAHAFGFNGTFTVTEAAVNQTGASYSTRTIQILAPPKVVPLPPQSTSHRSRAVTPRR
jgi:hypothetical protein